MSIITQQNDSTKFTLYAVNTMLQLINELPLENEEDIPSVIEATIAQSVLIEVKKEVLSEGWDFNTDSEYVFPIDSDGFISIPSNILDISDRQGDLIMRDWRLYSKSNQSAIFDESQSLRVIWDTEFNSLTHPIRNFITIRAARKFLARQTMDTNMYGYAQQDEESALMIARRSESFTGNYNMITGTYGVLNSVIG